MVVEEESERKGAGTSKGEMFKRHVSDVVRMHDNVNTLILSAIHALRESKLPSENTHSSI